MSLVHRKCSADNSPSKIDEKVVAMENKDKDVAFESVQNSKTKGNMNIDEIPEEKKPYQCSICDNSYTTKGSLKIHMDAVHEGKTPHQCSICNYSYARESSLKTHIKAVHEGKKPHKCSICDRSFVLKHQMKNHIKKIHG